ncbi:hypothetical protein [Nocardia stercoris]|uniref:hypothetical protein n=1 Tax=Nocardia stercoris TaxID=2483361 RepID=UPI001F489C77|nr:hypothetical protein [Nocardia stercoris]
MRRAGDLWELIHSRTYGRDVVLHTWPRDEHSEAFAHCHQLNGGAATNLMAAHR